MNFEQAKEQSKTLPVRRKTWEAQFYICNDQDNGLVCDQGYNAENILTDEDKAADDWIISTDEDYNEAMK